MPIGVGSPARGITPRRGGKSFSTSAVEFGRKVDRAGMVLRSPQPRVMMTSAQLIADRITLEGRTRGISTFAGRKWRGYTVRPRKGFKEIVIRPYNIGSTVILDQGSSPHIIGARALGTRKQWRTDPAGLARRAHLTTSRVSRAGNTVGKRALMAPTWDHPVLYVLHPGAKPAAAGFVRDGLRAGQRMAADNTGAMYLNALWAQAFAA